MRISFPVLLVSLLAGQLAASAASAPAPSFRNQVQPILAKYGCSSGACHGAAAGQNGFKLSLRGYDNEADHLAITRHALGRRINPTDPARSLLLLKPTGAVPHKGGVKFETNSEEYKILAEWIASDAPGPQNNDTRITRLEITPAQATLKLGAEQALRVRAHFDNGRSEDVTRWVKYTSANESVANVGEDGRLRVIGHGEGAITAWYLSRIAIANVSVPFTNKLAAAVFSKAPRRNFIDDLVLEKLKALNLPPSPRCTDAEFLRRAFLDTTGTLPTVEETRAFLADTSPSKRDALIERLLAKSEFVDYWSYKWSDLLLVSSRRLPQNAMWSYYAWIRAAVEANTPWDQFARRIVTATGSTLENGAANFFVLHDDPAVMAETTTQAFLAMSVNCAKCHNHPMEKWTNDEYFGFANLFARVRAKNGAGEGDRIIFAATEGDLIQPRTGRPQPPRPLEGKVLPMDSPADRRTALADWLTSRENPYFTRAIVNRIWANFFGVGIVEAADDLRVTNPASNEKLLSATAKFLADQRFDLKTLMRAMLQSETYQRSSQTVAGNEADTRFYSRYFPRRLMAEVILDAASQVTAVPTEFRQDLRNANRGTGPAYPAGLRALQLPDANIASYFLKTFGHADRTQTCECERTSQPSVAQMLHISNGDTLNEKLKSPNNRFAKLLGAKLTNEQLVEEAFLISLSRLPSADELKRSTELLASAGAASRREAVEDLFWALLSTKEFLFNH